MARHVWKLGAILPAVGLLVTTGNPARVELPDGPYGGARTNGMVAPVEYSLETTDGQRPEGFTIDPATGTVAPLPGGVRIVELETADTAGCARDTGNTVWCWTARKPWPTPIRLPADAIETSASTVEGCAILDDHSFHCWTWADLRPRLVASHVSAAAAGRNTTCTTDTDGTVSCTNGGPRRAVELPEPAEGIAAHGTKICAHGTRIHCWSDDLRPGPPENPAPGRIERIHVGNERVCARIRTETYCRALNGPRTYTLDDTIEANVELHGDELDCRRETTLFGYSVVAVEHRCTGKTPAWLGRGHDWLHAEKTGDTTCALDTDRRVTCGVDDPKTLAFRRVDDLIVRATGADGSTVTTPLEDRP